MSFLSGVLRLRPRHRDPACQEMVEMVTGYVEGAMSRADRRGFEHHLAGCRHCTEYLAQMRETIRLTGRLTPDDLTPEMRADFTDLYRRWHAGQ